MVLSPVPSPSRTSWSWIRSNGAFTPPPPQRNQRGWETLRGGSNPSKRRKGRGCASSSSLKKDPKNKKSTTGNLPPPRKGRTQLRACLVKPPSHMERKKNGTPHARPTITRKRNSNNAVVAAVKCGRRSRPATPSQREDEVLTCTSAECRMSPRFNDSGVHILMTEMNASKWSSWNAMVKKAVWRRICADFSRGVLAVLLVSAGVW